MSPKIGDKVTIHSWFGSDPAQIVKVSKSGKMIYIRRNNIERKDSGKLKIVENDFRTILTEKFTLRKDGIWRCTDSDCSLKLNIWTYKH